MEYNIQKLMLCRFSNGMMMLPYYHRAIMERLGGYDDSFLEKTSSISKYSYLKNLIKGVFRFNLKKKEILIITSTLHNVESEGKVTNNLISGYYDLFKDKVAIIEEPDSQGSWRKKTAFQSASHINSFFIIISRIAASFLNMINPSQRRDFVMFAQNNPLSFSKDALGKMDYFVAIYSFFITRLLAYIEPKVLIIEDASYGECYSIICRIAKERGIKVIEPQHGTTYKNTAYQKLESVNYSDEYYRYLPDVIFTFGKYWNNTIGWEYKKIAVGNAFLNNYLRGVFKLTPQYDLLIVSQPYKGVDDFIKELSNIYRSGKILLRLHPNEDIETNIQNYKDYKNIKISCNTSLYDDINNSRGILGWTSTCLYEALAFGKSPIIVDCSCTRGHIPEDIGIWIKKPKDILSLDIEMINDVVDSSLYWEGSFDSIVKSNIEQIIGF